MSSQMSADLIGWHRRDGVGGDTLDSQPRRGSMGVGSGRWGSGAGEVPAEARQPAGGGRPRLAAAMERGSVGQTFLSALVDVRRQECPRHTGAPFGDPVAACRYLSIPAGSSGSPGSSGSAGSAWLEDEDEDEESRTRTKIRPSAFLLLSTRRRDKVRR